jgi:hypothetical protein
MLWNLLRKEWRESRALLVAGLWTFWLMPVFLLLVSCMVDHKHELYPGIAWGILMIAGWFFALVVGAYTVCRDWGKPEEHFLLGRPVSPYSVILAKLFAGGAVVLLVFMVAGLWDLGVLLYESGWEKTFGSGGPDDLNYGIAAIITYLCLPTIGYCVAFAAAVVTRQMLTSVLGSLLTLLVCITTPMLSSRLVFLYPAWMAETSHANSDNVNPTIWTCLGGGFIAVVVVGIAATIALAVLSAKSERSFQVGHKTLAWTIALVVLALFSVAMTEMGNSLTLRDQSKLFDESQAWRYRYAVAKHNDDYFVLTSGEMQRHQPQPIARFQIDNNGKIQNLERGEIFSENIVDACFPIPQRDHIVRTKSEDRRLVDYHLTDLKFDDKGYLVLTGSIIINVVGYGEGLLRLWLKWPEGGQPEIVKQAVAIWPDDGKRNPPVLCSYAADDRYAYLVYGSTLELGNDRDAGKAYKRYKRKLFIFDWIEPDMQKPKYQIPLPLLANVQIGDDKLRVFWPEPLHQLPLDQQALKQLKYSHQIIHMSRYYVTSFDLDKPEMMIEKNASNWSYEIVPYQAIFVPEYTVWGYGHYARIPGKYKDIKFPSYNMELNPNPELTSQIINELERHTSEHRAVLPTIPVFAWNEERDIAYASDRLGLRILRQRQPWRWELIGEYQASPLTMMFREDPRPNMKLIDDSFLVEMTKSAFTVYDVSNAARPRRVGFYNVFTMRQKAEISISNQYLVVIGDNLISVLERPAS